MERAVAFVRADSTSSKVPVQGGQNAHLESGEIANRRGSSRPVRLPLFPVPSVLVLVLAVALVVLCFLCFLLLPLFLHDEKILSVLADYRRIRYNGQAVRVFIFYT